MWRSFLAFLASLAAEPAAIDQEQPRAAAAVAVAYAGFAVEAPAPAPTPAPGKCCSDCGGKGYITHGDGHRTPCPCPPSCKCKGGAGCPDGKCGASGVSPATASPAKPLSGR
jgi:hypothetical protein